jgi:hypothetical protein
VAVSLTHYRFRSTWIFDAPPDDVYAALYEVVDYPAWWRQVRSARKIDDDHIYMRTRSFLPYELAFMLIRRIADRERGILEARLEGDLEGVIRWSIVPSERGTIVRWEQEVETRKPLLRRLAPIARPAFIANHALMMSSAQRGLRAFLAGYGLRRREPRSYPERFGRPSSPGDA